MNKLLLGCAAMLIATSSIADLKLRITDSTDGSTPVTIDDAVFVGFPTTADFNGDLGQISYTIDTAAVDFTVVAGTGSESLLFPQVMDLAVAGSFDADATLTVELTETNLSGFGSAYLDAGLTSLASATGVSYELWVGTGNSAFQQSSLVATVGSEGVSQTGVFKNLLANPNQNFSLTLIATFDGKQGEFYSTDTLVIPEPSVIALFGAGLLGLGMARRRMKK